MIMILKKKITKRKKRKKKFGKFKITKKNVLKNLELLIKASKKICN